MSQSALNQAAGKLCDEGGAVAVAYVGLREELRRSKVVNTDDTGWRIAARQAYLMGFFTVTIAIFQIRWRHQGLRIKIMENRESSREAFPGTRGPSPL